MAKTFDEWWEDNSFDLSDKVFYHQLTGGRAYFSNKHFKDVLKDTWDASRQNMTYKDI